MSSSAPATAEKYYVPHGSWWPPLVAGTMMLIACGGAMFLNGSSSSGSTLFMLGMVGIILMTGFWFRDAIVENRQGLHSHQVIGSARWAMGFFIFSEVMFFGAFFGALFYGRALSVEWWSGGDLETHLNLYPDFDGGWPTNGPDNMGGNYQVMGPWPLPLLNTLILLTSGVTLTWAHWGLSKNNRSQIILGLAATVALGFSFLFFQVTEYKEAYLHLNLTMETGIYGATFFMLTGFHGAHVTLGAIMLSVCLFRALKGHFSPHDHFGFEAAAWYWHFVDVVWLLLFVFVYILI